MQEIRIIVATQNKHKIEEIAAIVNIPGVIVCSRDQAGVPPFEIEETGSTFEENSYIKAKSIMDITGEITIADDSGLEVDSLNGEPGVYSARYAGEDATDGDNNEKLLKKLEGLPMDERGAKFVSVITLVHPNGTKIVARGECEGHVITAPRGTSGFGYDPLFVPEGYERTFAELTKDEKNKISHRSRALAQLSKSLKGTKII